MARTFSLWSHIVGAVIWQEGAAGLTASNQITIHIAGDTGVPETDHETNQVIVAEEMAKDYDPGKLGLSPAFFLHLGDVIYGPTPDAYLSEFYRPYMHYPGKIVAIPGNHDGESASGVSTFRVRAATPHRLWSSTTVPSLLPGRDLSMTTSTSPGWVCSAPKYF